MVAYPYKMPSGIVGNISRMEHATVEQRVIDTVNTPTSPGVPIKMGTSLKIQGIVTGDAASAVIGWFIRSYPNQTTTTTFGAVQPIGGNVGSILTRGYLDVMVNSGTAAYRSPVYVRVGGASGAKVIGGVEAVIDPTTPANTVVIPGAYFMGAADANGNAEVAYNI